MKSLLISVATVGALMVFAPPSPSFAQGVTIEGPGVGVRVGEPNRWERDRWRERRYWREREVRGGCRTVTVERDDGSVRRIRRCDY
jgi:hypothetical protein